MGVGVSYPAIPKAPVREEPALDVASLLASAWAREIILGVALNQPRSLQAHLGPSEIGQACERRLAYRILGTPYVNFPDPLKSLIGTGFHLAMAQALGRSRRFMIEVTVTYRGITGSVDLYDTVTHRLVDWKTSSISRIRRYRREGIGVNYRVQTAIYAEAMRAMGYEVTSIVLVFVPRDADLDQTYAWVGAPDKALADEYIDRYAVISSKAMADGAASLPVTPGPLCGWCPSYMPHAVDLTTACPGEKEAA